VDVAGVEIDDHRLASLRSRHSTGPCLRGSGTVARAERSAHQRPRHPRSGPWPSRPRIRRDGWTYGAVSLRTALVLPAGLRGLTWATAGRRQWHGRLDLARWFRRTA
jgi:hypothetical protein